MLLSDKFLCFLAAVQLWSWEGKRNLSSIAVSSCYEKYLRLLSTCMKLFHFCQQLYAETRGCIKSISGGLEADLFQSRGQKINNPDSYEFSILKIVISIPFAYLDRLVRALCTRRHTIMTTWCILSAIQGCRPGLMCNLGFGCSFSVIYRWKNRRYKVFIKLFISDLSSESSIFV